MSLFTYSLLGEEKKKLELVAELSNLLVSSDVAARPGSIYCAGARVKSCWVIFSFQIYKGDFGIFIVSRHCWSSKM
jgi:hypothetical protein